MEALLKGVDAVLEQNLSAGWHELRCRVQVADSPAEVVDLRSMVHVTDESLEWQASVPLEGLTLNQAYPIDLSWQGAEVATSFRLMKGYRVLAEIEPQATKVDLTLDPKVLGLGPSRIHWEVGYEKGRVIRGPSSLVTVR